MVQAESSLWDALVKAKGCDRVDPEDADAYQGAMGLGLTEDGALLHLLVFSTAAHGRD